MTGSRNVEATRSGRRPQGRCRACSKSWENTWSATTARVDVDAGQARRPVTVVLATVAEVADDALLGRILTQLPPGHAGLFGRTDPL